MTPVHLTINDTPAEAARGDTILQAARKNGIDIPTLCAYEGLPPFGGCRMCVVEVDGLRGFPTSCTTPAEEGMVIRTDTSALKSLRLEIFNMLLSEHPLSCLVCPEKGNCSECMVTIRKSGVTTGCGSCNKDGQCEIQTLAAQLGVTDIRLPVKYRFYPVEKADPFYDRDYNLCVLCGRCVQVCEKLHFMSTLTFVERGPQAGVGTAFNRNHIDAGCSFCGACVDHCPTGTLAEKTRKWEGVAENTVESVCPYCSAGCTIDLQVKKGVVIGAKPGKNAPADGKALCVHGRFGIPEVVNHHSRMLKPWKVLENHRFEFPWEEAINLAAEKLAACPSGSAAVQVSSSLPVEDLYLAQKFASQVLAIPAKKSSGDAYQRLLRRAAGFDALREADCVLLAGVDTRYTLSWLEYDLKMVKKNGGQVISVNTQERQLERFADTFVNCHDDGADILDQLINVIKNKETGIGALHQTADFLEQSRRPVLLIGPACLADLHQVEKLATLADKLDAAVISLPDQGNVFGALAAGARPYTGSSSKPEVLYCIGSRPSVDAGFVVYQSNHEPAGTVHLGLPSAAFTEREGSFITTDFKQQYFHKAVEPAGLSKPDWQIIAAVAKQMGAFGFDHTSIEDLREEMNSVIPPASWKNPPTTSEWFQMAGLPNDPLYLGHPLSEKVAGLAALLGSAHVKAGD